MRFSVACIGLFIFSAAISAASEISEHPLNPSLTAEDLALIVNDNDKLSVQIADYYQRKRAIPLSQVIHLRFDSTNIALTRFQFNNLKQQVDRQTPKHVQAFVLTWLKPFRVECMSITTAFAAGFDKAFCSHGCRETQKSPYFASHSAKPFSDHGWRPTMTLAGNDFQTVKRVIDRGVASDYSHPKGTAYLLKTKDWIRSSRAALFPEIAEQFSRSWPVSYLQQNFIENKHDVMFYFTGLVHVPKIATNTYLPGAVADHLTSTGGVLTGSGQMNLLDWLEAGATASYGTVVEPCNFPEKFSHPGVLMQYYLNGSSLIEAYWKSVLEPGQGIFVGEPLAKPFTDRP